MKPIAVYQADEHTIRAYDCFRLDKVDEALEQIKVQHPGYRWEKNIFVSSGGLCASITGRKLITQAESMKAEMERIKCELQNIKQQKTEPNQYTQYAKDISDMFDAFKQNGFTDEQAERFISIALMNQK